MKYSIADYIDLWADGMEEFWDLLQASFCILFAGIFFVATCPLSLIGHGWKAVKSYQERHSHVTP